MTDASGTGMSPEEEAIMKNDPGRVRVSGPLSAYRDGFAGELARQGYTPGSAQRQVGLMAHLSRWLDSGDLGGADLTPECAEEFLEARRAEGYASELSQRGVLPLLVYLRALGVAPMPPEPVPARRRRCCWGSTVITWRPTGAGGGQHRGLPEHGPAVLVGA